jgi:hypothetical protein
MLAGLKPQTVALIEPEPNSGCWLWTGAIARGGLARAHGRGVYKRTYELVNGPVPAGLDLDHLCRVPSCVNPAHLEAVTHHVNLMRGVGACAQNARKTHCKRGHPLTPENLVPRKIPRGGKRTPRSCRICARLHARWVYARKKEAINHGD